MNIFKEFITKRNTKKFNKLTVILKILHIKIVNLV